MLRNTGSLSPWERELVFYGIDRSADRADKGSATADRATDPAGSALCPNGSFSSAQVWAENWKQGEKERR